MAHTVKWQRIGGSQVNIGHVDQKGFANPIDSDGLRRWSIDLILAKPSRGGYEAQIENLLTNLRFRPMVVKTTNFGRKYIVPNGSQGNLTTETDTLTTVYPESIDVNVGGDGKSAIATVTFVKALT